MFHPRFVIVSILALFATGSLGQDLEFVTTNVHLPVGRTDVDVVFDGVDSIYSLGGTIEKIGELPHWTREVIRYSLTNESIELVDKMVSNAYQGSGVWAGHDTLFYFGGEVHQKLAVSDIWRLPTQGPKNMSHVNELPVPARQAATVWDHGDYIYVIGGGADEDVTLSTILRYTISLNVLEVVAELPGARKLTTAVLDTDSGSIYILGGYGTPVYPYGYDDILRFDPVQGSVEKLEAKLPAPVWNSCAVWVQNEVYLFTGTYGSSSYDLIRFNPSTNEVTTHSVSNIPRQLSGQGCVYVEKLKRIYVLGGFNFDTGLNYWDTISYIELGTDSH